jgi:hypothetical protein
MRVSGFWGLKAVWMSGYKKRLVVMPFSEGKAMFGFNSKPDSEDFRIMNKITSKLRELNAKQMFSTELGCMVVDFPFHADFAQSLERLLPRLQEYDEILIATPDNLHKNPKFFGLIRMFANSKIGGKCKAVVLPTAYWLKYERKAPIAHSVEKLSLPRYKGVKSNGYDGSRCQVCGESMVLDAMYELYCPRTPAREDINCCPSYKG